MVETVVNNRSRLVAIEGRLTFREGDGVSVEVVEPVHRPERSLILM